MKNIVKRTTVLVRDMAVAMRWYEQVLGMTKWYDHQVTLSGMGIPAGNEGDVTHLVIMKCEDPTIGMIGLLQFIDPPLPAPNETPTRVTYGQPTFVISTDDVEELYRRAVAFGAHIHSGVRDMTVTGADGKPKVMKSISIFDPDGHFFECNQFVG